MSTELDQEIAGFLAALAPERKTQVLEYARWLRDQENGIVRDNAARREMVDCHELENVLPSLNAANRERVEDYVRALAADPPRGIPGHVLLRFGGTIPETALRELEKAIEEECERIDYEAW